MAVFISYLKQLKFDRKLLESPISKYLHNPRLVLLVVLIVLVFGIFSFNSLPKVLNPNINIAIVNIATTLPGAGPDEVEQLLTIPIEQAVGGVTNIDTMTSSSQNSTSIVSIQFLSGVDPDKATTDVENAVHSVSNLPKNATTPVVQKLDFQNIPVWIFTVTGKDPASTVRFSRILRDNLKNVPSVNNVSTAGLDNQEIQVVMNPSLVAQYGIEPSTLSQTITNAVNSQPAGNITSSMLSFDLTIDPLVTNINDLRNLRITTSNGNTVLLSEIAKVAINQEPGVPPDFVADQHHLPVPAVTFSVFKKDTSNVTDADTAIHQAVAAVQAQYPNIKISSMIDAGDQINRQFNDLVRDLLITFSLVFIVIVIFLGTRQAIVAASAIPVTFLITFIVMKSTGIDLSFIAFFSLLLALGLLVDDTIVVISAISAYYRTDKFTPMEAGLLVWRDFKTAILTTTLTTVWAFVPLLLSTGIIGEFIKPIPIVVSTALLASFGVAMFITLPIVIIILKPTFPHRIHILLRVIGMLLLIGIFFVISPKGMWLIPATLLFIITVFVYYQTRSVLFIRIMEYVHMHLKGNGSVNYGGTIRNYYDKGIISFDRISLGYRGVLNAILSSRLNRRKTIFMVIIFSLFSYILLPIGLVKNDFFPASSQESVQVQLQTPDGTSVGQTQKDALDLLNQLRKLPSVQLGQLSLGSGADTGFGQSSGGSNYATITLVLPSTQMQSITSMTIAQQIRDKYAHYPLGKVDVIEVSGGPPAGADLDIQLYGQDLNVLDGYADDLEAYLSKQPGVTNIDKSIKTDTSKLVFVPDLQKMSNNNITESQLGQWLNTYASGFTLDNNVTLEEGNTQNQAIVFRTNENPQNTEDLNSIIIPTQNGSVPLLSLGNLVMKSNPTLITRENGQRTISVTASVTSGYSATEKNADLEKYINTLNLPTGYSWKTAGVNQQNQESVTSILEAMVLSFMLIIITMVLQFKSFRKALIVMLVIPLSISGVFIVFGITQTPLSFPALIGILALFGIVVKNSILIVDKINQNLRTGIEFKNAIIDACESRFEPIALTSFTAIIGLTPITLSNALWQGLGGAIISGLLFSGSIMLFFIPVVYYFIFQNSEGLEIVKNETKTKALNPHSV